MACARRCGTSSSEKKKGRGLPIRSMLAVLQDILDQVQVLELLMVRIDGLRCAGRLLLFVKRFCGGL